MRHGKISTIASRIVVLSALCLLPSALFLISGCQETVASTQPSMNDRQENALKDPMGYTSGWENPDISGGGLSDFHKNSFNKDLNDVLNP